jgi:subtilase family serine protease
MDGDPTTGMLVGETQTFPDGVYYDEYRIGGTSLAAPLFAGMTALSFQHSAGLVYSVRTFNHDSSLTVNRGWDNVTGLGSPNHGWLTAIRP